MTQDIPVCRNIAVIDHLPRLSVAQLQVLLLLKKLDCATTNTMSDVIGYEPNAMAKVLSYIRHTLSDRPQLIKGEPIGRGKGNPQMWSLTESGAELVQYYLEGIAAA